MKKKALSLCTCIAAAAAFMAPQADGGAAPLTTERVANGLTRPVMVTHAPGDFSRLYIVEQRSGSTGRIKVLNLDTGVLDNTTPFLSIPGVNTSSEEGLLGLAFHPDYQTNDKFYVYYTTNSGGKKTRIVEYLAPDPDTANAGSADVIMEISQPFSNHNGGWIGFGPNDDYLYIATGDGGSACDPGERSQDITNQLLGKILRIDVDGDDFPGDANRDYAIPPDNPFVGITGDDEIFHFGLRNPYRCSFDRATGDLYMADVGQNVREEIDFFRDGDPAGLNYGWDCEEGFICSSVSFQCSGNDDGCVCGSVNSTDPIHDYTHGGGRCSITGGYVYRGCAIPELTGQYFFADFCSSQIFTLEVVGGAATNVQDRTAELDPPSFAINGISGFGEDAYGEIYICDLNGGEVFKVIADNTAGFTAEDCDSNNEPDACEILDGSGSDANSNGTLDACENLCPWDCAPDGGNGVVNFDDLVRVVNAISTQELACDVAPDNGDGTFGNGVITFDDLIAVINNFGSCP